MTTASPLPSRQPPRPAQAAPQRAVRSEPAPVSSRPKAAVLPFPVQEDDEFRMNLSDLPPLSTGLHVDGFTPSLVSRLLDLVERLRKR